MLSDRILDILKTHCDAQVDGSILVGLSGGPDSLTLLHLLHRLGYKLVAAHLDHALRETSADEARHVLKLCSAWNIPCVTARIDVSEYADQQHLSIEEAARECRYRFLFEQAHLHQAQVVAVAHTADDQVETVLMHLLRGAGTSGLRGMAYCEINPNWSQSVPVWRPLLGIWRDEIMTYCQTFDLDPLNDESNADVTFYRNRLRHVLIPELATYNPQIKQVLWRMADVMQADDALLRSLSDRTLEEITLLKETDLIQLDQKRFKSLQLGLQRRILRQAIDHLRPGLRDIGWDVVDRALSGLSNSMVSGRMDLAAGLDLTWGFDYVTVIEHNASLPVGDVPQLINDQRYLLEPGSTLALRNGWQLSAEIVSADIYSRISDELRNEPNHAWLNASAIKFPLIVRSCQPGERWKPLGMQGHRQKLSDMFINEKIPVPARNRWPLVFSDQEIAWVPGVRPSEPFKLQGSETQILHLFLCRGS